MPESSRKHLSFAYSTTWIWNVSISSPDNFTGAENQREDPDKNTKNVVGIIPFSQKAGVEVYATHYHNRTSKTRTLRQRNLFQLPLPPNTSLFKSSPLYFASYTFKNLPQHIRSIKTLPEFKRPEKSTAAHTVILRMPLLQASTITHRSA